MPPTARGNARSWRVRPQRATLAQCGWSNFMPIRHKCWDTSVLSQGFDRWERKARDPAWKTEIPCPLSVPHCGIGCRRLLTGRVLSACAGCAFPTHRPFLLRPPLAGRGALQPRRAVWVDEAAPDQQGITRVTVTWSASPSNRQAMPTKPGQHHRPYRELRQAVGSGAGATLYLTACPVSLMA